MDHSLPTDGEETDAPAVVEATETIVSESIADPPASGDASRPADLTYEKGLMADHAVNMAESDQPENVSNVHETVEHDLKDDASVGDTEDGTPIPSDVDDEGAEEEAPESSTSNVELFEEAAVVVDIPPDRPCRDIES